MRLREICRTAHVLTRPAVPRKLAVVGLALLWIVCTAGSNTFTNSWSLQPLRKPALPRVRDNSWPRTPIDYFILNALDAKGLHPSVPAEKRLLLRRVTFDLTGL